MNVAWERFRTLVGLGLWVFDIVIDIITLRAYWTYYSMTIAILGSVLMGISAIVGIGYFAVAVYVLAKGKKHDTPELVVCASLEVLLESVPQLCLNLYTLKSCNERPIVQYVSAAVSFVVACYGIITFDTMLAKEDEANLSFLDTILLFVAKSSALAARILILVYFAYRLAWWTALAIGVHGGLFIAGALVTSRGKIKEMLLGAIAVVLFGIGFIFAWTFDTMQEGGAEATIAFAVFYGVENGILHAIVHNIWIYDSPFCLYGTVLVEIVVNVCLNVAPILFGLLYFLNRKRGSRTPQQQTDGETYANASA